MCIKGPFHASSFRHVPDPVNWLIPIKRSTIFLAIVIKQLLDEVEVEKTEFNNCFIIHFSHNSSSETEAKRSAILFLRRTLQGA